MKAFLSVILNCLVWLLNFCFLQFSHLNQVILVQYRKTLRFIIYLLNLPKCSRLIHLRSKFIYLLDYFWKQFVPIFLFIKLALVLIIKVLISLLITPHLQLRFIHPTQYLQLLLANLLEFQMSVSIALEFFCLQLLTPILYICSKKWTLIIHKLKEY